jgi:hypothetical protein
MGRHSEVRKVKLGHIFMERTTIGEKKGTACKNVGCKTD